MEGDLREMEPAGDPLKPRFPTGDELAETAAIMRVLGTGPSALTMDEIARQFRQGRQVSDRVSRTIGALARLGHVATPAGDARFTLRSIG